MTGVLKTTDQTDSPSPLQPPPLHVTLTQTPPCHVTAGDQDYSAGLLAVLQGVLLTTTIAEITLNNHGNVAFTKLSKLNFPAVFFISLEAVVCEAITCFLAPWTHPP